MPSTSVEYMMSLRHHLSTFASWKMFGPQKTITNGKAFDCTDEAEHIEQFELSCPQCYTYKNIQKER